MIEEIPKSTVYALGAVGIACIIAFSFWKWRTAVKIAFVAVLFEGAIRKWVLPQASELVYFLKDIFLIGAYLRFFLFPEQSLRFMRVKAPIIAFIVSSALICLFAINPNINSAIVALYGLKIYLFYVPLAFLMPYLFRSEEECIRQASFYMLFAIPICLLGVAQFFSPAFSVLNTSDMAGGVENVIQFAGSGGTARARISGTFSFITNFGSFLQIFTVLGLACLSAKEARFRWIIVFVILPLLVANAMMSGSRAAVAIQIISIMAFIFGSFFMRIGTAKNAAFISIMAFCIIGAVLVNAFSEAVDAFETRTRTTDEGPLERLSMIWTPLPDAYERAGLTGLGIGLTHPASEAVRRVLNQPEPIKPVFVYDAELPQVIMELGALGFIIWYGMRLMAFLGTMKNFFECPPRPIRSFLFAALLVHGMGLVVSVVLNHTFHFYYWALYGLSLMPGRYSTAFVRRTNRPSNAATTSQLPVRSSHRP
ncbi:MAG: hypothetical protein QM706_00865 [Nitrospira sp.]